ncbi:MAG: DUF3048 domain-containing protein [Patescibacteria group bacterium]|nr:DUF3048 domain-containing protein [Patescibacteria group bacterium]
MRNIFKFNLNSLTTRLSILTVILVVGGAFCWFFLALQANNLLKAVGTSNGISIILNNDKDEEEEIIQYYRRFDGLEVDNKKAANLWPTCVMIENLRSVRPQNGLSDASIVYESLAEGGATRFMALFTGGSKAEKIGPIRSARPYYLDWVYEYACLYTHAGGSPQALGNIRDYHTNDLEALSSDQVYFWRDTSLYAPHNLFTSGEKLTYALRDKELLDRYSTTRMWHFKDDLPLEKRGADQKFYKLKFSSYAYEVEWKYIKEENMYLRYNADKVQRDANNNAEIKAKNVIIQEIEPVGYYPNKGRLKMETHGEGKAFVLRDGLLIEGSWKKDERTQRTLFYDLEGQEIEFNRGQTWIEVIPSDRGREW